LVARTLYYKSHHEEGSRARVSSKVARVHCLRAPQELKSSARVPPDAATSSSYLPVDYERLVPVARTIVRALGEVR
jgi:hypothetical protein